MRRALGAVGVNNCNHHVADGGDQLAVAVLDDRLVPDDHLAFEVRLDERLLVDLSGAADVEGAHGQLRAGLADRLGGDDADRLAELDELAGREIAAVALRADAAAALARQHRPDLHLLDAGFLNRR